MTALRACTPSKRRSSAALVLAIGLLLPLGATSAQLAELQPGARVRIRAPSVVADRLEGTVLARGRDSVTVAAPGGAPIPISIEAITEADVSRGRSRRDGTLKGAAWGAGVGLAMGLVATLGGEDCSGARCEDDYSTGEYLAAGAFSGASVGGVVGVVIGAERWQRLRIPARLTLRPAGGAIVGTIALRF